MPNLLHHSDTKPCFSAHMGKWMIEASWMQSIISSIQSGLIQAKTNEEISAASKSFEIINGIALIKIEGPIMKQESKFGGTSSIRVRQEIRQAANDPDVKEILLAIDSPGGHVAGNKELADEVKAAAKIKTVTAQIEDLGASAAFWVASQATRIFANEMAMIGSIGTVAVIHDTSEAFAREGVKVTVVSTGALKGAMTPGSEVTQEMIDSLQSKVDTLNEFFLNAVAEGRQMNKDAVKKVATGDTFIASEALELGLIDGIQTLEETFNILQSNSSDNTNLQSQAKIARAKRLNTLQSREDEVLKNLSTLKNI